jgi:hypothetical protein
MNRLPHIPLLLAVLLFLVLLPAAAHLSADGTLGDTPNPIGPQYGSTRAIDTESDADCADTQQRGDLIDFYAFSAPATQGSRWFFAFVVDSALPLNDGAGIDQPNYFIILDDPSSNGANGNNDIPFWNNSGSYSADWTRNMRTPGDHFVACFASGVDQLTCQLRDNFKQQIGSNWTVDSVVMQSRRYIEIALPDETFVPGYLRDNSGINTMVLAAYNSDTFGNPIDGVGNNLALSCHNGIKTGGDGRDFTAAEMIATAANCNTVGRPTNGETNDRQCLSLPARATTAQLDNPASCAAPTAGIVVDGSAADDNYTLLTEAGFAGPYMGGSTTSSDFVSESAAYRYCDAGGGCTALTDGADIVNLYARGDAYFLYLVVSGNLDNMGRPGGGADLTNIYLAIDAPHVTSNSAESVTVGVPNVVGGEFPNAPAGRFVNFSGWDVDRVVELIWYGDPDDYSDQRG